jgi:[protein-PII] uridylyltransferase
MNHAADMHLDRLRTAIADFSQRQSDDFAAGTPIGTLLRARVDAYDGWLTGLFRDAIGDREGLALFAVGGYGRGELHPQSDLDILILAQREPDAATRARIEAFVSNLWDLNLRPGHAVRTAQQCTDAASDLTVCTALMEARILLGHALASEALADAIAPDKVWPVDDYVQAKLVEFTARHARYGDTSYNLEPNLKEGPGGLRDIQTAGWIARRITGSGDPAVWSEHGVIRAREWQQLTKAGDHIQRLRFALHIAAGRAEERLLFDYQPGLAETFGFQDLHSNDRAVEQMMQAYFRSALAIRRALARIAARWRERRDPAAQTEAIAGGFARSGSRLAVADASAFARDAATAIRLFATWQQYPELLELTSATASALDASLADPGATPARSPEARAAFLDIVRGRNVSQALARMHLHGVLGAYLPAFAQVTGRMQYDLFHVFTVDQHTLNVLRNLDRIAAGEAPEFPQATDVFETLHKPELLFIAALFHDIAKGRGGDHSELGAKDALEFCRDHGLSAADGDLVAWLVRQHLLLSVTAQKSDVTDPAVINRFAAAVADRERLDALYLLTMADIAGTAPPLWNTWKARLIADLYAASRLALRRGLEHPIHADERIAECRKAALALLVEAGVDASDAQAVWEDFPAPSFLRYRPSLIAWVTQKVAGASADALPLVAARREGERGAREIFVHSTDVDGLFAAITAALDRLDLDVVEARVLTSRKGLSLDTFRVLERGRREARPASSAATIIDDGAQRSEVERDEEIVRSLRYALRQKPLRLGPVKRSLSRTQRHFHISAQIDFSPSSTPGRTRMALLCSDRPGLLALVAKILREQRVRIHGARIATFGERAEDFFVLSDESDQALDEAACERVGTELRERLDGAFGQAGT